MGADSMKMVGWPGRGILEATLKSSPATCDVVLSLFDGTASSARRRLSR